MCLNFQVPKWHSPASVPAPIAWFISQFCHALKLALAFEVIYERNKYVGAGANADKGYILAYTLSQAPNSKKV